MSAAEETAQAEAPFFPGDTVLGRRGGAPGEPDRVEGCGSPSGEGGGRLWRERGAERCLEVKFTGGRASLSSVRCGTSQRAGLRALKPRLLVRRRRL